MIFLLADHARGLVDLDVKLSPGDAAKGSGYNDKRNAIRTRCRLWRSRIIHYVLDDSLRKYPAFYALINCLSSHVFNFPANGLNQLESRLYNLDSDWFKPFAVVM